MIGAGLARGGSHWPAVTPSGSRSSPIGQGSLRDTPPLPPRPSAQFSSREATPVNLASALTEVPRPAPLVLLATPLYWLSNGREGEGLSGVSAGQ